MGITCPDTEEEMKKQLDSFIQLSPIYLHIRGDAQAAKALEAIKDLDRRMAAFWNYVRYPKNKRKSIAEGWVWSDDRIDAYKNSPEKKQADAAIALLAQLFRNDPEMLARKYTLGGDTDPRKFKTQLNNWLAADSWSVVNYGKGLRANLLKEMARCELSPIIGPADANSILKFGDMIERYADANSLHGSDGKPLKSPMYAVPGLSDHGQSHAIDFRVYRPGQSTLGPDGSQRKEWRSSGCAAALARAVSSLNATNHRKVFEGPLLSPDEPWHWVYHPPATPHN